MRMQILAPMLFLAGAGLLGASEATERCAKAAALRANMTETLLKP